MFGLHLCFSPSDMRVNVFTIYLVTKLEEGILCLLAGLLQAAAAKETKFFVFILCL